MWQQGDIYKLLEIYFLYLGINDIYNIFKGMMYNPYSVSYILLFNAATYYFSFKKVFMFFMKLMLQIKYPW
jgi:hypothetical protein